MCGDLILDLCMYIPLFARGVWVAAMNIGRINKLNQKTITTE